MDSVEQGLLGFCICQLMGVEIVVGVFNVVNYLLLCCMSHSLLIYELGYPFLKLTMVLEIEEIVCWFFIFLIKFFLGADLCSCDKFFMYCF